MSSFRFHLGAKVALSTSVASILAQMEQDRCQELASAVRAHQLVATLNYIAPIEAGVVIARAEYARSANSYLVRYRSGDGRQIEAWHDEDALAWDPREPAMHADADAAKVDGADIESATSEFISSALSGKVPTVSETPPSDPDAGPRIRVFRYAADGGMITDITIPLA